METVRTECRSDGNRAHLGPGPAHGSWSQATQLPTSPDNCNTTGTPRGCPNPTWQGTIPDDARGEPPSSLALYGVGFALLVALGTGCYVAAWGTWRLARLWFGGWAYYLIPGSRRRA